MKKVLFIVIVVCAANSSFAQSIITNIGGNGVTQYIGDGWPATSYSLAAPSGICLDNAHNVFISDYADHRIRKIDTHDTLTTFADTSGMPGYTGDGGLKDSATFRNPSGLCFDASGNLYILEWYNDVVRRIDKTTGIVSTVAGSGAGGYGGDNGPATTANMERPSGICMDPAGNIFIADYGNHRIRRVDAVTNIITTFAGDGTAGSSGDDGLAIAAKLNYPNSVCSDSAGNIFISDFGNNRIRKVNAVSGIITNIAGTGTAGYTGDGGLPTLAKLRGPNAVHINRLGNLYISDEGNNVIRRIGPSGNINTIAGSGGYGFAGDGGPATAARFNGPTAVYADDSDYLYIADGGNSVIWKVSPPAFIDNAGIDEHATGADFKVFPNPSTGNFNISFNSHQSRTSIVIYNSFGQVIHRSEFTGIVAHMDLGNVATGIYIISTVSSSGIQNNRIIIGH